MRRRSLFLAAAFVAIVAALQPAHDAVGAAKNKAGIVIRTVDGDDVSVRKLCVFFDEPSISGLDLLNRSGVTHIAEKSALGSAICSLDGHGCEYPSDDCFCEYPRFWGYWIREPGETRFTFASTGAADHEIRDGSVDGWSWGKDGKPAPPDVPFADVCAAKNVASSASPTRTVASAPVRTVASRPNYAAFAGFALLFAALAGGAVVLRRRRAGA